MFDLNKNKQEYYLLHNGSTIGPFSFEDIEKKIKDKSLSKKTQIYKNEKWLVISDVEEFKGLFLKKKRPLFTALIIGLIIGISYGVYDIFMENNNAEEQEILALEDEEATVIANEDDKENEEDILPGNEVRELEVDLLKDSVRGLITNYLKDIGNETFDAWNYYAYKIDEFINRAHLSPNDINLLFQDKTDFLFESSELINIESVNEDSGNTICSFWMELTCWRTNRNKWQNCKVNIEIVLNSDMKITSWRQLKVEELVFESNNIWNEKTNRSESKNMTTYVDEDGKMVYVDECYVIFTGAFTNESQCKDWVDQKRQENLVNPGYLWIPDYPSLSGKQNYASFIGIYKDKEGCKIGLDNFSQNSRFNYCKKVSLKNGSVNPERDEIRLN
jgi:hypothetical protein